MSAQIVYSNTLKKIAEKLVRHLAEYAARKFTGRIEFHFDFRDGGVAHIGIQTKHTLRDDEEPLSF